ncbi:MAG TPA: enoyl-CoA hydratase/isomerase family protein [Polyangia bacterium]|nr:enoyl-CoA hydratase/isomerase family protein [Polyangia bacterium]
MERIENVALIRIDTGKGNAINVAWLERMNELLFELSESDARAVVITGSGAFFSAGLDLPSLLPLDKPAMQKFIQSFNDTMLRLFEVRLPMCAAVNGHAVAGGCVLALQADYRIMSDGAFKIGLNEVPLGLGLPAVVVETLRSQVPASSLLPIALDGRLLSPHEALELELIQEVAPEAAVVERAVAWARERGNLPQVAFQQVKRSLRRPAIEAVKAANERDAGRWTESWFSESGQQRIREAVARLSRKK